MVSLFKAIGAGFSAFGTAFQESMEESKRKAGSASEARERLTFTLRLDRVQCNAILTPEKLEAIRQDIEQVVPEIVRKHTEVGVVGTKVALGHDETGGRMPVIRAEFNLVRRPNEVGAQPAAE